MSLLEKAYSLLTTFDIYGMPMFLMVSNDKLYHTSVGTFFSLGILVFTLISFVFLMTSMVTYSNPTIVSENRYEENPPIFTLTPENFRVSLIITNYLGQPIKNTNNITYFIPRVFYVKNSINSTNQRELDAEPHLMVPCTEIVEQDKTFYDVVKGAQTVQNYYAYCIPKEFWDTEKSMIGGETSNVWNYLSFVIQNCDGINNPFNGTQCANKSQIANFQNIGYVGISMFDYLLDQQSLNTPFKVINKRIALPLSQNLARNFFYLKHAVMKSFLNPLYYFGTDQVDHVLQLDHYNQDTSSPQLNSTFAQINFSLQEISDYYHRSYQTIFDVLAKTSGVMKALVILFGLLLYPLAEYQMKYQISKKIYSDSQGGVQFQTKQPTERSPIYRKGKESGYKLNDSKVIPFEDSQEIGKLSYKESNTTTISKKNNYNLSLYQQYQQKATLIQSVEIDIDIINILNRLNHLERLKELFLTDDQLRLFEMIQKPEPRQQNMDEKETKLEQLNSYLRIIQQPTLSRVDQKIIELLDPSVSRLCESNITVDKKPLNMKKLEYLIDDGVS